MSEPEGQEDALASFLTAYWQDREEGRERSLEDYLAAYPGNADGIAREFLALRDLGEPDEDTRASLDEELEDRERAYEDKAWIGSYRLIQELGRGGQGVVHLAEDTRLRRRVALKVLPLQGHAGRNSLERFRREAEITSRLEHPGICPVYDTGVEDGLAWIAMRFVEGQTLAQVIRHARRLRGDEGALASTLAERTATVPSRSAHSQVTEPAEIERLCLVFEQAARALDAAHQSGVIHRDVKPGNIILDSNDEPLLLDFGLALEQENDGPTLTMTGDVFGTPAYMAPEQIRGERDQVDGRTDVYSLGVTLYECLTLERPFQAPTREALYRRILAEEALPPSRLNRGIGHDLQVVVSTAMAKEPDRRYRDAAALAEDLRRVREREPILARPAGPILRFSRWYRRSPALAGSVTAAFVILVAGVVTGLLLWQRAERETGRATTEARRADRRADDVRRLSDARRLDELIARFRNELWPPLPRNAVRYTQWITDAEALLAQLPRHRERLERLRRSALDDPEASDAVRRRARPDLVRLIANLERRIAAFEGDMESIESEPRRWGPQEARDVTMRHLLLSEERESELLARARRELAAEPAVAFADEDDAWWFDQLGDLVDRLQVLRDGSRFGGRSLVARARERATHVTEVERRTITDQAEAWAEMAERVAKSPLYRGLDLQPQIGLIPRGLNAEGYAEFELWSAEELAGGALPVTLVLLPGGVFRKGAEGVVAGYPTPDNEQIHWRRLRPFFVSKYEVTHAQWVKVVGSLAATSTGSRQTPDFDPVTMVPNLPVRNVSWTDARHFCRWLGLDLPTEDQWEFACRGTLGTRFAWGDDPSCLEGKVNLAGRERKEGADLSATDRKDWIDDWDGPCEVSRGAANAFGLFHLHGNVSEWCLNVARGNDASTYYAPNDGSFPHMPIRGKVPPRYVRGGSFTTPLSRAGAHKRERAPAMARLNYLGFRPVRALDP